MTRKPPPFTPANSNTRVSTGALPRARAAAPSAAPRAGTDGNLGLNSDRQRHAMVQRLREQGIADERVLNAMSVVPRHLFVDEALASRAYENAALPIGHGQTISQPWVVAHMLSAVLDGRAPGKVLEVGAGCAYQAAVLAQLTRHVYAIERIKGLYDNARENLRSLGLLARVRLSHGDGMLGLPGAMPFDTIVLAAAGPRVPQTLLDQLAPGGRLIAPEGGANQRLVLLERTATGFSRRELDAVRFVPLRAGIQS